MCEQRQDTRGILTPVLRWTQEGKENGNVEKKNWIKLRDVRKK
jgi:hypothetical protein